jgi:hypothetical protein
MKSRRHAFALALNRQPTATRSQIDSFGFETLLLF